MKHIVHTPLLLNHGLLFGAGAALFLAVGVAQAQVGTGWTEYSPSKQYNGGEPQADRYSKTGNVEHLWIYSTDPSAFPGQDSGPRSEWRVQNDYTTGSQQFQGDFQPESGTDACTVFQIFGSTSQATSIQLQMRSQNGTLKRYNTEVMATGCWGIYHRVNVVHYTSSGQIQVWINGCNMGTFADGGNVNHYFKYGVYATASVSSYAGVYYRDVRYFQGGSAGSGYFQIQDSNSGKDAAVQSAATTNGAPVILWTFGASHNDQWKLTPTDSGYYQIVNRHSGKDLTVLGASTQAGAPIIQYTFGAAQNDQWEPVPLDGGLYKFINRKSGLVLDVAGGGTSNGTAFEQWGDNGGDNQSFQLIGTN